VVLGSQGNLEKGKCFLKSLHKRRRLSGPMRIGIEARTLRDHIFKPTTQQHISCRTLVSCSPFTTVASRGPRWVLPASEWSRTWRTPCYSRSAPWTTNTTLKICTYCTQQPQQGHCIKQCSLRREIMGSSPDFGKDKHTHTHLYKHTRVTVVTISNLRSHRGFLETAQKVSSRFL